MGYDNRAAVLASVRSLHMAPSEHFKSNHTNQLLDYWNLKRGNRPRPKWTDLRLMDIHKLAPFVCVRDVVDGMDDLYCRFWGSGLATAYTVDCTGKLVSEMYSALGVQNTLRIYHQCLASDLPLRLIGNLGYADKAEFISFEGIMLRLDGKDSPDRHVIGAFQFDYVLQDEDMRDLAAV